MTVILATQESEIKRITVRSQSGQIVCKSLLKTAITKKRGWWNGSSPSTTKKKELVLGVVEWLKW
jgi:hypothetical protein